MAVVDKRGSGEFVPVEEWSCRFHERPHFQDDDEAEWCNECAAGKWRKKRDDSGEVVMRELSIFEIVLIKYGKQAALSSWPDAGLVTACSRPYPLLYQEIPFGS